MPSYQFKCFDCSITAVITQPINASIPNPMCAQCKKPMQRIYTAPPVQFRGTGWGKNR
jgi:putative FmdB family regulatory protein